MALVTRDWLFAHYTLIGLDCVQIGAIVGRDPKSVWSWMKSFGLQTRPRGHNVAQLPRGRAPGFKLTEAHKQAVRNARIADGRRPYLKDGKHWLQSPGAVHPNWQGGLTPERQSFYCTEEWRDACKAVWARANASCERCGTHHNTAEKRGTFHVHHRVSFMVRELRAVVTNLVLLCATCHRFVHGRSNVSREFLGDK